METNGCKCSNKSDCLKPDCPCFDSKQSCSDSCSCTQCSNRPDSERTVEQTEPQTHEPVQTSRIPQTQPVQTSRIESNVTEGGTSTRDSSTVPSDQSESMSRSLPQQINATSLGLVTYRPYYPLSAGNSNGVSNAAPVYQLNQFRPRFFNAGHVHPSLMINPSYIPFPPTYSNPSMIVGTSIMFPNMAPLNQFRPQDYNARYPNLMINPSHIPSPPRYCNCSMMIGTSTMVPNLVPVDPRQFLIQFRVASPHIIPYSAESTYSDTMTVTFPSDSDEDSMDGIE